MWQEETGATQIRVSKVRTNEMGAGGGRREEREGERERGRDRDRDRERRGNIDILPFGRIISGYKVYFDVPLVNIHSS